LYHKLSRHPFSKMSEKWNRIIGYSILTILFIIFVVIVFTTENSYGGDDNFAHFKFAYWGWKYPEMLFNHWGKPIFTLLISPFARFGFNGARIYNVIVGLLTAFFSWKIAQHFKYNHSWVIIILVLFTPIYFILMFTALTEVTFSFFMVLAVYLFFKEKHILSAIVLSFLPIVRTEGIFLIPLFILAWSLKRKFIAIPFLSVGFFIISLLGWQYHDGFWWLITEIPYTGSAKDIYGSGSLFHFADRSLQIFGFFIGIFFVIGILFSVFKWIKTDRFRLKENFYFLLLVVGSFIVFYVAHSIAWWKGIGNSLGLIRVIGAVTPLAALTVMSSISVVFDYKRKWWNLTATVILIAILTIIIKDGIYWHRDGFNLSRSEKVLTRVADFIEVNKLNRHKVYYFSEFLSFKLNLDPKDSSKSKQFFPGILNSASTIPDSSIIVWDAHFGPNEGRTQLEFLKSHPELVMLKEFKPAKPFKVLGGYDYEVVVFQKNNSDIKETDYRVIN